MIQRIFFITIGIASLACSYPFAAAKQWIWVIVIALSGLAWWYGWTRKMEAISSIFVVAFIAYSILGIWAELSPYGYLIGLIAVLSAWDLDRFDRRLKLVSRIENEKVLVLIHLLRLGVVDGIGLVLGGAALAWRVHLDFGLILLLGLIVVLGLSQVINYIKREISKI